MRKLLIGIFVLLLLAVGVEVAYLLIQQKKIQTPQEAIPKTEAPQKSTSQKVGNINFVTYSEVQGMELKLNDPSRLSNYLSEKGILTRMETGIAVLGEGALLRPLTIEVALVAEKQPFLKLLSRDENGDVEIRSVSSKWDATSGTYTFLLYVNPQIMEAARREGNAAEYVTLPILEALYTVSTPDATDEENLKVLEEIRDDSSQRGLKFFSIN